MEEFIKINHCICFNNFVISLLITNGHQGSTGLECSIYGLGGGVVGVFFYRLERGLYLWLKGAYTYLRVLLYPLLCLVEAYSHLELNYHADIGPGLLILHHSMGVTINGRAIIGKNLTLTGGNVIGGNKAFNRGDFLLGENVFLGANSVIIGPVTVGNNVKVGAMACVVKNVPDNVTVVGVPAKIVENK